jgi:hypothetical protein
MYDVASTSPRCNLRYYKHVHLLDTLPAANTFFGVPFFTCLTKSDFVKHNMLYCFKLLLSFHLNIAIVLIFVLLHNYYFGFSSTISQKLPNKVVPKLHIPDDGLDGLCVGDSSSSLGMTSIVPYTNDEDGKLIFRKARWNVFHTEEDKLQVGQAVPDSIITHPIMSILFVIDII